MKSVSVIARAFQGEPLKRVAVDQGNRLVYITTKDRVGAVEAGEWEPTGFPKEDIFLFDSVIYQKLQNQWTQNGKTDPELWRLLSRYVS